jgi:hypothetical protein
VSDADGELYRIWIMVARISTHQGLYDLEYPRAQSDPVVIALAVRKAFVSLLSWWYKRYQSAKRRFLELAGSFHGGTR